jgi:hypothetical protein
VFDHLIQSDYVKASSLERVLKRGANKGCQSGPMRRSYCRWVNVNASRFESIVLSHPQELPGATANIEQASPVCGAKNAGVG